MHKIFISFFCLSFFSSLFSSEIGLLYQKNVDTPRTQYEEHLVDHVSESLKRAFRLESKLTGQQFVETNASKKWRKDLIPHYHSLNGITKYSTYHLLNNIANLPGVNHLHVGLLGGDSFISTLYGNQMLVDEQIAVDWFMECPKEIFNGNIDRFLDRSLTKIIDGECFKIDKTLIEKPIDFYFYDADHSLMAHEKAITYFDDIFADVFIVVIDDWSCSWIRGSTFKAFEKLGYTVLYQDAIMNLKPDDNGQYVAVIRKSDTFFEVEYEGDLFQERLDFEKVKSEVVEKTRNSWCSKEKTILMMELLFKLRPEVCVEVGSFTGSSFLPIVATLSFLYEGSNAALKEGKKGHAYAIDAWSNKEAIKGISITDSHYIWWLKVDMERVYKTFLDTLGSALYKPYFTVVRSTSADAADLFEQIDFLHLDGNFTEEGSLIDTQLYLPKVASGGYILVSNVFGNIDKKLSKIKSLDLLLEYCETIIQVDNNQTILLKKY